MKFINLTPHAVVLNDGRVFETSGIIARVSQTISSFDENGIAIASFGEIENLPEPKQDTMYIVSGLVASAAKDRCDLVSPATNHKETKRSPEGQIISVPGFIKTQD